MRSLQNGACLLLSLKQGCVFVASFRALRWFGIQYLKTMIILKKNGFHESYFSPENHDYLFFERYAYSFKILAK